MTGLEHQESKQHGKGGARPGAGRPKLEEKRDFRVTLCATATEIEILERYYARTWKGPAEVVRGLFEDWLKNMVHLLK